MRAPQQRFDAFGLGLQAFDTGRSRSTCPYPAHHVEGRQWLTGWDYSRSRSGSGYQPDDRPPAPIRGDKT